ncbi:MAG: hypothetical protein NNA23_05970 [Nitrospira sp.]|nr:hypothetical protein [Nitrospira sp.]MCP9464506.1 hypothetical protein [Nitrospira sp.]
MAQRRHEGVLSSRAFAKYAVAFYDGALPPHLGELAFQTRALGLQIHDWSSGLAQLCEPSLPRTAEILAVLAKLCGKHDRQ